MNKINIGTRLVLSFSLILILLITLAGIGIWRIQGSSSMADEIMNERLANERLISEWSRATALNAVSTIAAGKVIDPKAQEHFDKAMTASGETIQRVQQDLARQLANPEALELFQVAKAKQTAYLDARDNALKARAEGDFLVVNRFFETEIQALLDAATTSVDDLLAYQRGLMDKRAAILHDNNEMGLKLLVGLAVAALLAGIVLAFTITRSITHPLHRAVAFARSVSTRDLTGSIQVQGTDETSQLLQALKQMNGNLMEVVGDVRSGADSIASAASQIAAGNVDLSSRTEEQASSLAETAATMEELTTTVKQNADHAQQASGLAASAVQVAVASGEVVAKVVDTMGAINSSAKQVVDIISVIDSIAFQTNILALNAAVEAARAGEQGRGFAVVATEVRALAQRSASAAKEIKSLIDTSVSTTEEGNKLVVEAGVRMNETVASVRRVTDIMSEITAASQEQSVGIDQVNQAISQMDQVTQQNAALVEEASAAAASLQEQASALARLVATFKIGESASAPSKSLAVPAAPGVRLALAH